MFGREKHFMFKVILITNAIHCTIIEKARNIKHFDKSKKQILFFNNNNFLNQKTSLRITFSNTMVSYETWLLRINTDANSFEPHHDKTNKMACVPSEHSDRPCTQISLGIRPVWSESLLSAWRKLGSLATHWVHSKDSDQTGRMPRLIWVFAERSHFVGFVMTWPNSFQ